jgi:hypothetical protein
MDASIGPPPVSLLTGGGTQTQTRRRTPSSRRELTPYKLSSSDEEEGVRVGFDCVQNVRRGVLYAKFEAKLSDGSCITTAGREAAAERATKAAITTLFDIAEACRSRKITIGLGPEDAGSPELVCSLLYLGFQVVPLRKFPNADAVLMLDLETGWVTPGNPFSSDYTCTGTSNRSTSAEEDDDHDGDSDSS